MMRWLKLWLVLTALVAAGWQSASAAPFVDRGYAGLRKPAVTKIGEYGRGGFFWRRRIMRDRDDRSEDRYRDRDRDPDRGRNFDAEKGRRIDGPKFWGGPYWGYGARLGHPCETCRSNCKGGERAPYCERCRARCGW